MHGCAVPHQLDIELGYKVYAVFVSVIFFVVRVNIIEHKF